uniref:Wsv026-like protein n=1 Tax=Pasiphaea japonica whispovirus TaxID=2984286 RepID=A0A9C7CEV6_9VIRU|nr:MAG: wsv026-like protein [Pasiphaea japonica whispovirus]
MAHGLLFMEEEDAREVGTLIHQPPTFHMYESENLQSVGLCDTITNNNVYPKYLPRPMDINSVQALAVRLALVQLYKGRGWKKSMSISVLIKHEQKRKVKKNKIPCGGFIIGDGTGVGKTREIAAFVVSVILYEKALSDVQKTVGPSIFGHDATAIMNAGLWRRAPFFIWLTCSRTLFDSCQQGMREVVTNSRTGACYSWEKWYCSNKPVRFRNDGKTGFMTINTTNTMTQAIDTINIRFLCLQDVKNYVNERGWSDGVSDYLTASPSILFMTYADLNANLEFVLKFLTGGTNIDSNMVTPIDNYVTAILCDEFHQPRNISDAFRAELEKTWKEEDYTVLHNILRKANPSVSEVVTRFRDAMANDKQFKTKRIKCRKKSAGKITTSNFLHLLRQSDSFRLFIEVMKYDSFYIMASATPFQSNADLHLIDHIFRRSAPAYTRIAAFNGTGNSTTPDAIAEDSEYATVFLEQAVKLLKNRGQLVSRCISIANVECSVVNCNATPFQKFAMDELSSYCINARQLLIDCKEVGHFVMDAFNKIAERENSNTISLKKARCLIDEINSNVRGKNTLATTNKEMDYILLKIDDRFKVVLVEEEDVGHDGETTIETILQEALDSYRNKNDAMQQISTEEEEDVIGHELYDIIQEQEQNVKHIRKIKSDDACQLIPSSHVTENIFIAPWFEKLKKQYFINTASTSVSACKSALLTVKSHAVIQAIQKLRKTPEDKKAVMSLEQTGDSYLTNLSTRICDACRKRKMQTSENVREEHYGLVDTGVYDSSPLANTIFSGYRLLCRAVAMSSTFKFKIKQKPNSVAYVILLPIMPPIEPLVALSGNPIDSIVQTVGESNHAEITNRKLCSRNTARGMILIKPNTKTANTNKCIDSFNNTKQVDVIMLGPKGSTGLSLHDSKSNSVAAKRIHCLLDVPYNAIAFLQTIGRTHRNGQATVPHYLIFSTDSPAERRFFDSLENRVKDSKAGTYADRYSNNSISITSAICREQFLDKGLVLKTAGNVIRVVACDLTPVEMIDIFAKMMLPIRKGGVAFVEGLDIKNGIFIETVTLALHITLVVLGEQNKIGSVQHLSHALSFASTLRQQVIFSIASSAAKFAYSNLCLHLVHEPSTNIVDKRVNTLRHAAYTFTEKMKNCAEKTTNENVNKFTDDSTILPARKRDTSVDIFSDLVRNGKRKRCINDEEEHEDIFQDNDEGEEKNILHIIMANKPTNYEEAIKNAKKTPDTVRILGTGSKEGVINISECYSVPSVDMLNFIPVITASSVIQTISKENHGLLFMIHNAALPHRHTTNGAGSFMLGLARRLSNGSINYRQFQNNFFCPIDESKILYDIFANVKCVMARDERLDGLCDTRMNGVMGASYIKVRKKPECVFIANLLDEKLRRHVVNDDDEEYNKNSDEDDNDNESEDETRKIDTGSKQIQISSGQKLKCGFVNSNNEGHDMDIVLCNGNKITLTKENSAFVKKHIDSFVAGNLIGTGGSILQVCFDNCNEEEFKGMPKFCLYDSAASQM